MTKVEATVRKYYNGFALDIPEEARCLFPPNGDLHRNTFRVKSDVNSDPVWVSKRHSSGKLDHIHVTGKNWWKQINPQPREGDTVVIQITESKEGRCYRIP
jgi:hypothetical protein